MRLDKYLAEVGLGSRSEVKLLLKKKLISVNGKIETSPKYQVKEGSDLVTYQGQDLVYEAFVYYLLNKPEGVISTTEDNRHKTVLDLLDDTAHQKAVFPVGRLDIDTTGLLLLTNNGPLAHALLSPKRHVDKTYLATVEGLMTAEDVTAFEQGIILSDHHCQSAKLEILEEDLEHAKCQVKITIREGKFHQVKRMVASCGKKVLTLKRLSMGILVLDETLSEGEWRRLTADEVARFSDYGVPL